MNNNEIKKRLYGPFCLTTRLELNVNREELDFQNENNPSSKSMRIDLLIIRKSKDVIINNEIGKIFRGHNILEYKSPEDSFNIDTYFKVLGYACIYKSTGETIDTIEEDDITLSFVREGYPRELMKYFQACGYGIEEKYPGIYYVSGNIFPIQVVVSGSLDHQLHLWLTSLTRDMEKARPESFVIRMSSFPLQTDWETANSVLEFKKN